MSDVTETLPPEIKALFRLLDLTLRDVADSSEGIIYVVLHRGRWMARKPGGVRTLAEWQRFLTNIMPT